MTPPLPIPSTTMLRAVPNRDEASQLAHDLNNLLAIIGGHADALEPALPASGDDHDSIVAIQRAVMSGAKLAERVRKLGGTPAPVRGVDVAPVVERAGQDAVRRFGHRLTVTMHAAPGLWSVSMPPTLVEPVLTRLLGQAVDVMPHGGTLSVRCMNVELGTGLIATAGRRERYVRIELSAPTVFPGAGPAPVADADSPDVVSLLDALGRAGGRLCTESDGASMTTWALLLPSDGVEPLTAPTPAPRGATILLLDADGGRSSLVQALLQRHGFAAHVAPSVDAAAQTLGAVPVDLLVADIALSGAAGDAAHLARRHAVTVLPIRTTGADASDDRLALAAPFTADQLLAGVEAALGTTTAGVAARVLPYRGGVAVHGEEIA